MDLSAGVAEKALGCFQLSESLKSVRSCLLEEFYLVVLEEPVSIGTAKPELCCYRLISATGRPGNGFCLVQGSAVRALNEVLARHSSTLAVLGAPLVHAAALSHHCDLSCKPGPCLAAGP